MGLAFSAVGVTLFYLLNRNIESTLNLKLRVDEKSSVHLLVNTNQAYKIKRHDKILIRINEKYYKTTIQGITFDEDAKLFKLEISKPAIDLIPSSVLDAKVIYKEYKVIDAILGGV